MLDNVRQVDNNSLSLSLCAYTGFVGVSITLSLVETSAPVRASQRTVAQRQNLSKDQVMLDSIESVPFDIKLFTEQLGFTPLAQPVVWCRTPGEFLVALLPPAISV